MANASRFGFASTTDEVLDGIDLSGKAALVTGASGGLGEETARALAAHGASVAMTARDLPRGEAAAEKIRNSTGNTNVEVIELELDSLASVRKCADAYVASHDRLDLLINKLAGVMACPFGKTQDGFETQQFGTNHPRSLRAHQPADAGAPRRSSGTHHQSQLRRSPRLERALRRSQLRDDRLRQVRLLRSKQDGQHPVLGQLDRRQPTEGSRSFAVHPGAIVTDLGRHMQPADIEQMMSSAPAGTKLEFKQVASGAATSCYAATSSDLDGRGGLYLEDCGVAEVLDENGMDGVCSYALDADAAQRLWTLSEQLVGERFDP